MFYNRYILQEQPHEDDSDEDKPWTQEDADKYIKGDKGIEEDKRQEDLPWVRETPKPEKPQVKEDKAN